VLEKNRRDLARRLQPLMGDLIGGKKMNTKSIRPTRAVFFLSLFLLLGSVSAFGYTSVGISLNFHDALSPYGSWVNVSHYGSCWRPSVAVGWRPYTYGHWVYSSYGPTWDSYEPFGWAAYHYGNWVWSPEFGWVWVPGYDWSPGRVAWSYGDDYIGWRPAYYGDYYGGNDFNLWVFIDSNRFGYNNYSPYVIPRTRVRDLFNRRAVRIVREPLRRTELERIVRRPVQTVSLKERTIDINGHRTRLRVPASQERQIVERLSRVSKGNRNVEVAKSRNNTIERSRVDHGKTKTVEKVERSHGKSNTSVATSHGKSKTYATKSSHGKSKTYATSSHGKSKTYATTSHGKSKTYASTTHGRSTSTHGKSKTYASSSHGRPDTTYHGKAKRVATSSHSSKSSHPSKTMTSSHRNTGSSARVEKSGHSQKTEKRVVQSKSKSSKKVHGRS
jgi:hypothetical protein